MLAAKFHQRPRGHALRTSQHLVCNAIEIHHICELSLMRRLNGAVACYYRNYGAMRGGFKRENYCSTNRGMTAMGSKCPPSQTIYGRQLQQLQQLQQQQQQQQQQQSISNFNGIRFFSKFSTDSNEAIAQDPGSSHSTTPQLPPDTSPATTSQVPQDETDSDTKPSIDYLKPTTHKMKQLIALKEAYITLSKTCIDATALLNNNVNASTPDELVAMADYFLVLVNSVELETAIDTIQSLQYDEDFVVEGDSVIKDVLSRGLQSMHKLHNLFLRVVQSCVPPNIPKSEKDNLPSASFVPALELSKYSPLTTGRALQVSHRAEELGMPMHKPLYQRMAVGIVLTSPLPLPKDPGQWPWDKDSESVTSSQQVKEGVYGPSPSMEILNLCHRAKVAFKCAFSPSMPLKAQMEQSLQQQQLEMEMYTDPWLLMLKRRQFQDAVELLRGWESYSHDSRNKPSINLLYLVGEDTVHEALEIAKDWLVGTSFPDEISTNPHANELISLMQDALGQILKRRKTEAGRLSKLLTALAALEVTKNSNDEDDDFNEISDDDNEFSDSDSEEEFEEEFSDEFDSDIDEGDLNALDKLYEMESITRETFPLLLKGVGIEDIELKKDSPDNKRETSGDSMEININFVDEDESEAKLESAKSSKEKGSEPLIVEGFSNDEILRSIYMRKGPEWELPDIVSQLEDWNKGKALKFTPEYEQHLGWQLTNDKDDTPWS